MMSISSQGKDLGTQQDHGRSSAEHGSSAMSFPEGATTSRVAGGLGMQPYGTIQETNGGPSGGGPSSSWNNMHQYDVYTGYSASNALSQMNFQSHNQVPDGRSSAAGGRPMVGREAGILCKEAMSNIFRKCQHLYTRNISGRSIMWRGPRYRHKGPGVETTSGNSSGKGGGRVDGNGINNSGRSGGTDIEYLDENENFWFPQRRGEQHFFLPVLLEDMTPTLLQGISLFLVGFAILLAVLAPEAGKNAARAGSAIEGTKSTGPILPFVCIFIGTFLSGVLLLRLFIVVRRNSSWPFTWRYLLIGLFVCNCVAPLVQHAVITAIAKGLTRMTEDNSMSASTVSVAEMQRDQVFFASSNADAALRIDNVARVHDSITGTSMTFSSIVPSSSSHLISLTPFYHTDESNNLSRDLSAGLAALAVAPPPLVGVLALWYLRTSRTTYLASEIAAPLLLASNLIACFTAPAMFESFLDRVYDLDTIDLDEVAEESSSSAQTRITPGSSSATSGPTIVVHQSSSSKPAFLNSFTDQVHFSTPWATYNLVYCFILPVLLVMLLYYVIKPILDFLRRTLGRDAAAAGTKNNAKYRAEQQQRQSGASNMNYNSYHNHMNNSNRPTRDFAGSSSENEGNQHNTNRVVLDIHTDGEHNSVPPTEEETVRMKQGKNEEDRARFYWDATNGEKMRRASEDTNTTFSTGDYPSSIAGTQGSSSHRSLGDMMSTTINSGTSQGEMPFLPHRPMNDNSSSSIGATGANPTVLRTDTRNGAPEQQTAERGGVSSTRTDSDNAPPVWNNHSAGNKTTGMNDCAGTTASPVMNTRPPETRTSKILLERQDSLKMKELVKLALPPPKLESLLHKRKMKAFVLITSLLLALTVWSLASLGRDSSSKLGRAGSGKGGVIFAQLLLAVVCGIMLQLLLWAVNYVALSVLMPLLRKIEFMLGGSDKLLMEQLQYEDECERKEREKRVAAMNKGGDHGGFSDYYNSGSASGFSPSSSVGAAGSGGGALAAASASSYYDYVAQYKDFKPLGGNAVENVALLRSDILRSESGRTGIDAGKGTTTRGSTVTHTRREAHRKLMTSTETEDSAASNENKQSVGGPPRASSSSAMMHQNREAAILSSLNDQVAFQPRPISPCPPSPSILYLDGRALPGQGTTSVRTTKMVHRGGPQAPDGGLGQGRMIRADSLVDTSLTLRESSIDRRRSGTSVQHGTKMIVTGSDGNRRHSTNNWQKNVKPLNSTSRTNENSPPVNRDDESGKNSATLSKSRSSSTPPAAHLYLSAGAAGDDSFGTTTISQSHYREGGHRREPPITTGRPTNAPMPTTTKLDLPDQGGTIMTVTSSTSDSSSSTTYPSTGVAGAFGSSGTSFDNKSYGEDKSSSTSEKSSAGVFLNPRPPNSAFDAPSCAPSQCSVGGGTRGVLVNSGNGRFFNGNQQDNNPNKNNSYSQHDHSNNKDRQNCNSNSNMSNRSSTLQPARPLGGYDTGSHRSSTLQSARPLGGGESFLASAFSVEVQQPRTIREDSLMCSHEQFFLDREQFVRVSEDVIQRPRKAREDHAWRALFLLASERSLFTALALLLSISRKPVCFLLSTIAGGGNSGSGNSSVSDGSGSANIKTIDDFFTSEQKGEYNISTVVVFGCLIATLVQMAMNAELVRRWEAQRV
ncbi:unnamed protein product [Amoebophrya sp. A25]|nr:unnamed protein product [Amoebophrya sp. A25]|eukprot:GSA25T00027114001.1